MKLMLYLLFTHIFSKYKITVTTKKQASPSPMKYVPLPNVCLRTTLVPSCGSDVIIHFMSTIFYVDNMLI